MIIFNIDFFFFNIKISKILFSIFIRNIKNIIYKIDKYVIIIVYIKKKTLNELLIMIKMIMKIHIIDNFKINIFIKNDVFILQKIKFDFVNDKIIINLY